MESTTYVVEAIALIEGIHILKKWIYDGTAQLVIPTTTLNQVEAAFKASIAPTDAPNDAPKQKKTRQSGKPARKEHPLFDINPRIAWEFIERAQSEKGISGVMFQQENEVFTQWKREEEERVAKAETPLPPPSSFADALQRKSAINEEREIAKTPSKPKLTARSKENKATWKIEKVPRISSFGLSEDTKSLLSCTLWKIYEGKKNPLQPVRYVLLAHEEGIKSKAMAWGIATTTIHQIKERLLEKHKKHDDRDLDSQLEQKFPGIRAMTKSFIFDTTDELDNDYTNSGMINTPGSNESISDSVALKKVCAAPIEVSSTDADLATPRMKVGPVSTNERQHGYSNDSSLSLGIDNQQNLAGQSNDTKSQKLSAGEVSAQIEKILDAMLHKDHDVISGVQTPLTNKGISTNSGSDYELESDEEIIVFNPRNRRTSGVRGSSSRPGSSGGFIQKTYKAGIQVNSRPTSSLGLGSLHGRMESLLKNETINNAPASQVQAIEQSDVNGSIIESNLKALLDSKLKAQSPVFTPGQPFLASPSGISAATGIMHTPAATVNSVTPPTGPRLPTTRNQGRPTSARGDGQELVRMQKENGQRIIQRQREVIQRQSKTAEMGMKTKGSASPRVIQMQPTNNPTIIDPDAFDRSYVVQPPTKPVPRHNGEKRRSRGNYNRNSAKESPKVNAKQNGHVAEPDVDFVLTCGAPRGSTRGKGKLWVP